MNSQGSSAGIATPEKSFEDLLEDLGFFAPLGPASEQRLHHSLSVFVGYFGIRDGFDSLLEAGAQPPESGWVRGAERTP
jgi:hypothetical protein